MLEVVMSLKIRDIIASRATNAEAIGRIVKKEPVTGISKKLERATLEDDTGSITLNLWGPQVDQCHVGDLVKVSNAYVKFFRGKAELNTWKVIEILERERNNVPSQRI